MATGAPYNMEVETYGRSPLECGSFIVSSAYPDPNMWGASFLARLSGSTAEFLSMFLLVMVGAQPFRLSAASTLELALRPAIPADLFRNNTVSFKFLGVVDVTYHNPGMLDTWTTLPRKISLTPFDGDFEPVDINGPSVPMPYSEDVRNLEYSSIDVYF